MAKPLSSYHPNELITEHIEDAKGGFSLKVDVSMGRFHVSPPKNLIACEKGHAVKMGGFAAQTEGTYSGFKFEARYLLPFIGYGY